MITRRRIIILLVLAFVVLIAFWSRLRYVEESDYEPQRTPFREHPVFQKRGPITGP